MAIHITIPLTPVTKKNHQQIMRSSKTGKPFVMPSAEYRQYEAQSVWHCKRAAISAGVHKPIDTPCEVRCLFYMPSRRRVDLTNLLESADDALVAFYFVFIERVQRLSQAEKNVVGHVHDIVDRV